MTESPAPANIRCQGTMIDIFHTYSNTYNINYTLVDASIESLNEPDGPDIVINPYSYKMSRFLRYDYGYPFLSSPEYIFSLKPPVMVNLPDDLLKH